MRMIFSVSRCIGRPFLPAYVCKKAYHLEMIRPLLCSVDRFIYGQS